MSQLTKVDKRSEFAVYGYCRSISESFMIDEIVNICVAYYFVAETFDPDHNYHGMSIELDKDNKYFVENRKGSKGGATWTTICGKTIVKEGEIFCWEFEVFEAPKPNINTSKMVIGIIRAGYVKDTDSDYTFTPSNLFRRETRFKNINLQSATHNIMHCFV